MRRLIDIEGFDELNAKLKALPDRVKRLEVLKIMRRQATPIVTAYRAKLPVGSKSHTRYTKGGQRTTYQPGNLRRSVGKKAVNPRKTDGNPVLVVRPLQGRRNDGYYRFMVVPKGFRGSGRGSRKGSNTVVPDARNAALSQSGDQVAQAAQVKVAGYVQKRIDQL